MPPAVFRPHTLQQKATNFKQSLKDGLKLAITLRYLFTGEAYKSLQVLQVPITGWLKEPPYVNSSLRYTRPYYMNSKKSIWQALSLLANVIRSMTVLKEYGMSPYCCHNRLDTYHNKETIQTLQTTRISFSYVC